MEKQSCQHQRHGQDGEVPLIWKKCILQNRVKTGEDALGNDVYKWIDIAETAARFTPWTAEQIAVEGRDVAVNERRFALPIPFSEFPECHRAVISGKPQEITKAINLFPRFTLIQVKSYKG